MGLVNVVLPVENFKAEAESSWPISETEQTCRDVDKRAIKAG